jgi:hypothetical protein
MIERRTAARPRVWSAMLQVVCVGLCMVAARAHAQTPAAPKVPLSCNVNARLLTKYNGGYSDGIKKADTFFASSEVAKNKQKLQSKMIRALDKLYGYMRDAMSQETREGRRCRVQGLAEGYIYRLVQLLGQCVLDGAQWAQFASDLYCDLSVELGGLGGDAMPLARAPVGLCGTLFEQVCDSSYAYIATEGQAALSTPVKSFLSSRGVVLQPYPGCKPYTTGAFEVAFESAVDLDCAYQSP